MLDPTAIANLPVRIRGFDWDTFKKAKIQKKVPHALLFTGMAGLGKAITAKQYAGILLCQSNRQSPCGACTGCQLYQAGNHPDYHLITLDDKSSVIKVDQIRALLPFLQQTPQQGAYRVVIINPAEGLNTAAANSLLKILEEPADNTVLILVTSRMMQLPMTLRSRCVPVPFLVPARDAVLSWLARVCENTDLIPSLLDSVDGAPLAAFALAQQAASNINIPDFLQALSALFNGALSPVTFSATWVTHDVDTLLLQWLRACHGVSLSLQGAMYDLPASWLSIQTYYGRAGAHLFALYEFMDALIAARGLLLGTTNPNQQLLLEKLSLQWCQSSR